MLRTIVYSAIDLSPTRLRTAVPRAGAEASDAFHNDDPPKAVAIDVRCDVVIWSLAGNYLPSDDWIVFACSRCATKAGRTLTSSAFNSAFCALGTRVLSIASITAW